MMMGRTSSKTRLKSQLKRHLNLKNYDWVCFQSQQSAERL